MYRILLVEGDAAQRERYARMRAFADCGFRIETQVPNGGDALEALQKERFDLLLANVQAPLIDGLALLRRLRAAGNPIPTVLAGPQDQFEYARQGMILGATDYLVKPATEQAMRESLDRVRKRLDAGAACDALSGPVHEALESAGVATENPFARRLGAFFAAHLRRTVTMEEAAAHMGLSKDYFGKLCKNRLGLAFGALYAHVRVTYAKQLLREGAYKTLEISELLGYASPDYFTRIFKAHTGMTPSVYKRQNKQM